MRNSGMQGISRAKSRSWPLTRRRRRFATSCDRAAADGTYVYEGFVYHTLRDGPRLTPAR